MEHKKGHKKKREGRPDGREPEQLRRYKIHRHFQQGPAASVLIEMGNTKVICLCHCGRTGATVSPWYW